MYPSTSTQQPAAICALKSPADAIHILEAVRLGLVPRVTRRLTGHERSMIRPGTVWVWEEEETNMRRWTDGRRWGASRVGGGGFLVYTESSDNLSPPPSRGSQADYMGRPHSGHAYSPYGRSALKPESLIKQTYSTTMTHPVTGKAKKFHVVAYSSKHNPQGDANNPLPLPHQLPLLASLKITSGIWPEWEHRRDPDYTSRRASSYPPPPSGSLPVPVTATASADANDQYGRGRSPPREAYPARATDPYPPQQRYPHPYTPQELVPPGRDPYALRPPPHQGGYPPPPDRYHPYHDPSRSRPYAAPPPSAVSSASTNPMQQPVTPQEAYYDDRRYNTGRPSPPSQVYAQHPYDPYARGYARRDPYYDEIPPAQYYDPLPRSPQDKVRERDEAAAQHARHAAMAIGPNGTPMNGNGNTPHVAGPSPEHRQTEQAGGRSPNGAMDSGLLNPKPAAANGQTSAPPSASASGFTLPPLRMAIDDRGVPANSNNGTSPSGYGRTSPRVPSDGGQSADGNVKGEDARQLGELGKRVSL